MPTGMFVIGTLAPLGAALKRVDKVVATTAKEAAFKLEAIIVQHIQDQDLPWKALDDAYKKRKKREGFSELIWVRTGTALETVRVFEIDSQSYFVGWVRGTESADGEDMVNIAAVMEFGPDDDPGRARPVVEPSVEELAEWFEKRLEKQLKVAFAV